MPDTIIQTENLGKSYMIGHQSEGRQYVALRDVIANKTISLFENLFVRGHPGHACGWQNDPRRR